MGNLLDNFRGASGILGSHIEASAGIVSKGVEVLQSKVAGAINEIDIVKATQTMTGAMKHVTENSVQGIKISATLLGDLYGKSLVYTTRTMSDSAYESSESLSQAFTDGEEAIAHAFRKTSNLTGTTMESMSTLLSDTFTSMSETRTIDMIQTFATLVFFFTPMIFVILALLRSKSMTEFRNVMNWTSLAIASVASIVLTYEFIFSWCNHWFVSPNSYIYMEFSIYLIFCSFGVFGLNFFSRCFEEPGVKTVVKEDEEIDEEGL